MLVHTAGVRPKLLDDAHTTSPEPGLQLVPGWEQYPWLRAAFSTRIGGSSQAYGVADQNLSFTPEDNPANVEWNRARFVAAVAADAAPFTLVTQQQVHGAVVRNLDTEPEPWISAEGRTTLEGDGLLTACPGKMLGIVTADCVPVLLADTRTHAVAALHAGWRGTLARIVQHGVEALRAHCGSSPADLVAAIGPAIGPCCFAIGDEVRSAYLREFPDAPTLFRQDPAEETIVSTPESNRSGTKTQGNSPVLWMDLPEANRRQLVAAGVPASAIHVMAECTACMRGADGRRRYFSYRAEGGRTGRMLSLIGTVAWQPRTP